MSTVALRVVRHGARWREDLPGSPLRWLLLPVWLPFRLLTSVRNLAYDHGLLAIKRLPIPVIAIGNLTAGGTGKTPAALAVVAALRARGRKPMIVARGYRGIDGKNDEAHLAGDIPVICQPDRILGGRQAMAAGADCVVLDDGFQHRRLHRDLDIVLIDATRPWGRSDGTRGAVLPMGYLRETSSGLRRADLLWLSRTDLVSPERLAHLRAELAGCAPMVEERTVEVTLSALSKCSLERPQDPLSAWRDTPVILASGIGNPAAFAALGQRHGLKIVASHWFPDHHHYTAADAKRLTQAACSAQARIVVTTKDAVKLHAFSHLFPDSSEPGSVWVMAVRSALVDDQPLLLAINQALQRQKT